MKNFEFRKSNGEKIENLIDYIKDYINTNKNSIIYIGCDSKRYNKVFVKYLTTIVFKNNNGSHVIFSSEIENNNHIEKLSSTNYMRLRNEVQRVVNLSLYLNEFGINVIPSIDINSNKNSFSNQILNESVGYLKGCGFKTVLTKPFAWPSSCVADHFLK